MKEKKTKRIFCRITEREYNTIKKSKIKISDIFYYGLNGISKEDNINKILEIKRIGNNLNQIAKKINQKEDIKVYELLKEILKEIKRL